MVAFTYIAKKSGGTWAASRISSEEGPELSAEADDTFALQQELKKISIDAARGGGVQTLLTTISKDQLVFQVGQPFDSAFAALSASDRYSPAELDTAQFRAVNFNRGCMKASFKEERYARHHPPLGQKTVLYSQ